MGDMPDVTMLGAVAGLVASMGAALVYIVKGQMDTITKMVQGMMDRPPTCALHEEMRKDISELKEGCSEMGKDIEELKVSTAKIDVRTEEMQKRLEAIAGNGLSH